MRRTWRPILGTFGNASCPAAITRRRCAALTSPRRMARSGRSASRCNLHNAPCSIRVGGSYGDAGRVGNPIPQSVICRVGERDGVWQAGLLSVRCYETVVDPVINHPRADAVSLANLIDAERSGGKRRTGNAMLVTDPAYHGDGEGLAG